jgi:hypothetical protein
MPVDDQADRRAISRGARCARNCQGAPLARTELATTFRAMANLPGDFALKDGARPLEHMDAHSFMGFKRPVLAFSSPFKQQS